MERETLPLPLGFVRGKRRGEKDESLTSLVILHLGKEDLGSVAKHIFLAESTGITIE